MAKFCSLVCLFLGNWQLYDTFFPFIPVQVLILAVHSGCCTKLTDRKRHRIGCLPPFCHNMTVMTYCNLNHLNVNVRAQVWHKYRFPVSAVTSNLQKTTVVDNVDNVDSSFHTKHLTKIDMDSVRIEFSHFKNENFIEWKCNSCLCIE